MPTLVIYYGNLGMLWNFCGYNAPSVKKIGVTSLKVISVAMGGLTTKKAYDRTCLEDFWQMCFGRVVRV